MRPPIKDIVVIIDHPHGRLEIPLQEWIEQGPGPRDLLRPIAARSAETGEPLPLTVIPRRYRNSFLTRSLVRMKLLKKPWP